MEANADDGLLEVFGFKQGWHASFVMVELISAKHIAQVHQVQFKPVLQLSSLRESSFISLKFFLGTNSKWLIFCNWMKHFPPSGCCYSIWVKGWSMEKSFYADGWRTVETTIKEWVFNFCWHWKGSIPLSYDQWGLIWTDILNFVNHLYHLTAGKSVVV